MPVLVNIKWGKETFESIECDIDSPPAVFKAALYSLCLVPMDRQKLMLKGVLIKDDEWGKAKPTNGAHFMLMGSADAPKDIEPPKDIKFIEDLPESVQANMETKAYGSGLQNLGNTCYLNSTLQCLYSVKPLRQALSSFSTAQGGYELGTKLTRATKDLFHDMEASGSPFPPFSFLSTLREKYPQFSQQTPQGHYMQQDAEEAWTNLLFALREKLVPGSSSAAASSSSSSSSVVDSLLGIDTRLKLTCDETKEEIELTPQKAYMLKCNISPETSHLHEGITLGLKDDREMHSPQLNRLSIFKGDSKITSLPQFLTVQMMRFFFKAQAQQKAKILKKISYGLEIDVYENCSAELQKSLDGPRAALKARLDAQASGSKLNQGSSSSAATDGDALMADAPSAQGPDEGAAEGGLTGKYELMAVLTHKGRSADSGHYVAWVRQEAAKGGPAAGGDDARGKGKGPAGNTWVLFDDDELSIRTDQDVMGLSGGGDWHMAYLLLYKAVRA